MVRTKLTRLLCFVGAGTVCAVGINKYRELERNSMIQKQQQQLAEPSPDNRSNANQVEFTYFLKLEFLSADFAAPAKFTNSFKYCRTHLHAGSRGELCYDSNHCEFQSCFRNWIAQQYQDLEELLSGLSTDSETDNEKLNLLVEMGIKHFEEYSNRRASMLQLDAPSFLSPSWCSPFENAFLWIGGCRPSLSVRLVYSVGGLELNDHLSGLLLPERKDNLGGISGRQLHMIDALHCKTIREEDGMSSRMASLQEEVADLPAKTGEVEQVIDVHCASLAGLVREADRLRISTLKELLGILTPRQGVDFLVATKRLHLSLHEWGKRVNHQSEEQRNLSPRMSE